mmetsp:Transcript_32290/g.60104  ORF Transcript_32290/g.60104 Transcript_32290/m.60104 type:complete len:130 (+) Transcript_32290:269-658(+)
MDFMSPSIRQVHANYATSFARRNGTLRNVIGAYRGCRVPDAPMGLEKFDFSFVHGDLRSFHVLVGLCKSFGCCWREVRDDHNRWHHLAPLLSHQWGFQGFAEMQSDEPSLLSDHGVHVLLMRTCSLAFV